MPKPKPKPRRRRSKNRVISALEAQHITAPVVVVVVVVVVEKGERYTHTIPQGDIE
jgi:hypothetical protein